MFICNHRRLLQTTVKVVLLQQEFSGRLPTVFMVSGPRQRPWADALSEALKSHGFEHSLIDESVLVNIVDPATGKRVVIAVYVDDLNCFGDREAVKNTMSKIVDMFDVSGDPIDIRDCLGPATGKRVVIAVYVDDLNCFGDREAVKNTMSKIVDMFDVSGDPIDIRDCLGPRSDENPNGNDQSIMYLAQRFWIEGENTLVIDMEKILR